MTFEEMLRNNPLHVDLNIPSFNEVYNYFLLEQEDELFKAQIRLEEAVLASTRAEKEAKEEAEQEISCIPLYEAEEQAVAQDENRKAKHRKSRKAERDEYHHHRKPYWKYRDLNNRFPLNRKAEKRRLKVDDILSQYEAEEQVSQDWADKKQEKEDLYLHGEDNNLWKDVSENGMFSYSCPEDFGEKFFEIEEEEDHDDDTHDNLSGDNTAYNCGYNEGYDHGKEEGYEAGYTAGGEIGYNRGYTVGFHKGREEGRKYILDLLKQVGINVDLEALIEQSLKC